MNSQAPDETSDHKLLVELREGNQEAAEQLYYRYVRRLMALTHKKSGQDLANRFDPEDIIQSVFGSFFRRANEGLYDVPEGSNLWPLLLVITLNKIRAYGLHHRAYRRDVQREVDSINNLNGIEVEEKEGAELSFRLLVEDALAQLPPHYRQIIRWRLDGHTHEKIVALSGRTRRSVERIFQECRAIFQKQFPEFQHGSGDKES
jgi:RNA polymerase sigma-70 factor (ECF subfamily)